LTIKRNDKASASNRKPYKNADSLNKSNFDDEHASICDSVEFKDSLENHNDSLYKITNGIKKLKTSSDIETLDESLPHNVYGFKTNGATTTTKKKVKKPVVVIRARKSRSLYPTNFGKSSLLKNESDFESYLTDQNYPSKSSMNSKLQTKHAPTKLNVKIIGTNDAYVTDSFKTTQFATPKKLTTKPCLTLHLVKDEELIPLRNFSNDFWENFSSEHFAASDFFE
jgi:Tfp pilus assembly protein PilE